MKGDITMMYTVQYFDEATYDDVTIFTGTLTQCMAFKAKNDDEEEPLYIVAPDGFSVIN